LKDLSGQRCLNHPEREAVAICPECKRSFCRECVIEHEDRVLCASCIRIRLQPPEKKHFILSRLFSVAECCLGFLLLWILFYALGQMLISIPSYFHEGTVWKDIPGLIR